MSWSSFGKMHVRNKALRALRAHHLFQLWTFSLCIHCKTKTNKISRIFKKLNFVRGKFLKIQSSINFAKFGLWRKFRQNNPKKNHRNAYHIKYIYHIHLIHERLKMLEKLEERILWSMAKIWIHFLIKVTNLGSRSDPD